MDKEINHIKTTNLAENTGKKNEIIKYRSGKY